MLEWGFLLRGMLIGFAIAAPVGPIGVLCIRRTLADGRATGFASGMGAATADLIYGAIAALGLTTVANVLTGMSFWTRLVGGIFLCYLGVRTLREAPAERPAEARARGLLGAYVSTFALTITNPATILSFAAVFAGMGAANGVASYVDGIMLVVGVFSGSALWWLLLSGGVSLLRSRVTPQVLRWVNVLAGLIILAFGLVALGSLVG
ncbi:LysE family translocator [Candidatus Oscillochloris fontis]|uniref:LysE family translocator n=1 Tax=Candidatus Oscillochloris fontis TaxID=2496868 RepID=UPI00101D3579|nr:LysE family transporter [Candidatus Oscillochloris fontis]